MNRAFWRFWVGETVSAFGSSFTQFAIPLLVFKLTGSPIYLAASTALFTVPHLLFGLLIGAWTDRTDRRRLMIATDLLAAVAVVSVPLAAGAGALSVRTSSFAAAANPSRREPPSFSFRSWRTTRMRGSAAARRRTISGERSVDASSTTMISCSTRTASVRRWRRRPRARCCPLRCTSGRPR